MALGKHTLAFFDELKQLPSAVTIVDVLRDRKNIKPYREALTAFYTTHERPLCADIAIDTFSIKTKGSLLQVTRYQSSSEKSRATMVYFAGCASVHVLDTPYHGPCSVMAKTSGCCILRVDVRVAPEYDHDVSVQDAYEAVQYFFENAEKYQLDPACIGIAGNSAGANLAAVVTNRIVNEGQLKLAAQMLIAPRTDATLASSKNGPFSKEQELDIMIVLEHQEKFIELYKPTGQALNHPNLSPLFSDIKDAASMPKTVIICGEHDAIRNDSVAYYHKLKTLGVDVKLIVIPEQAHGAMLLYKVIPDGPDPAEIAGREMRVILEQRESMGIN